MELSLDAPRDLPGGIDIDVLENILAGIQLVRSNSWCAGNSRLTVLEGQVREGRTLPVWVGRPSWPSGGRAIALPGQKVTFIVCSAANGGTPKLWGYSPFVPGDG